MREGLTFTPPLAADFAPVKGAEECDLQPGGTASTLPNFSAKPIHLVGSELGLIAGLPCAVKAFAQAGITAKYTYLPDLGFNGNGHFMMAETDNGELAQVIIDLAAEIK